MASVYCSSELSYKRLVPIYYLVNILKYIERSNIWNLFSKRLTQTGRRKKRGYFQEQIPIQNCGSRIEVKD